MRPHPPLLTLAAGLLLAAASASAGDYDVPERRAPHPRPARTHAYGDKLIATGGLTQIEGAAGGGIVPWALIAGGGTADRIGASAFYTNIALNDYRLNAAGIAFGFYDRLELSFAAQAFQLTGAVFPGNTIKVQVAGAKLRLFGDAVFAQDSLLPQVAVGAQFKRNQDFNFIPKAAGARGDAGADFYLSATKLYLGAVFGRNLLLNATVRGTKANQTGLLGFGGARSNGNKACFEASAALFLNEQTALGGEYRHKPDNLSAFREEDWADVFLAYFPNKSVAITTAYARLGRVAGKDQNGLFLSLQASY